MSNATETQDARAAAYDAWMNLPPRTTQPLPMILEDVEPDFVDFMDDPYRDDPYATW